MELLKAERWLDGLACVSSSRYLQALYESMRGDFDGKLKVVQNIHFPLGIDASLDVYDVNQIACKPPYALMTFVHLL